MTAKSAAAPARSWAARAASSADRKSDAKAVVVLDYRMVDAETSEVVGSGEARGESKRTSKGFGAAMFAGGVGAGGGFNMTSSNFARNHHRRSHHGRREQALRSISPPVLQRQRRRPRKRSGRARRRCRRNQHHHQRRAAQPVCATGQTFTIYHKGKEIKDPKTGEVLDVQTTPIGTLTITIVRDRISTGTFAASGGAAPVVGDVVTKVG